MLENIESMIFTKKSIIPEQSYGFESLISFSNSPNNNEASRKEA